jgi:hypothetical protein
MRDACIEGMREETGGSRRCGEEVQGMNGRNE